MDLTQEDLIDIARNDSDWKIRSDAVSKITDEEVLKEIFRNDSIVMVKIKAIYNIYDIGFLRDECLNNPQSHVRHAILNRILDEKVIEGDELDSLLTHLTLNDPEAIVSQIACRNLSVDNQDIFVEVARSGRDDALRREAASKITDVNVLKELALNDKNRFVRLEAIQNQNLDDVDTLTDAIIADGDKFNRFFALSKILDADSLCEIIFDKSLYPRLAEISENITFSLDGFFKEDLEHDVDEYHWIVAVNFLQDKSILEDIVKNNENGKIVADAIKNRHFNNQEILKDLIENDARPDVVLAAADKTDDENLVIDYVMKHMSDSELACRLIFKIKDIYFLNELSRHENMKISSCAARQLIKLKYYLSDLAMHYPIKEIRIEAIGEITDKHQLVRIAHNAEDRDIAIVALNNMVPDKLINRYLPKRSVITDSLNEINFRIQLDDLVLSKDKDIQILAISKLNRKEKLDIIIENETDSEIVGAAEKRLDTLWQDLKLVDDENVLKFIAQNGDEDVKSAVKAQINDLKTWRDRISEINDITDVNQLKYIANNDYNYYVRCEAEGKLENLLFNIRLDEIDLTQNQEKFKSIACDETCPLEIRKKASSYITDEYFNC